MTWPHTRENPPPVTTAERNAAQAAATSAMVDAALTGTNAERAAQFKAGMVGNYHYLETIEPIKALKREGRLEEALQVCYGAIAAAEHAEAVPGGREPAPWYTEQAAIIHRKRGEHDDEVAVLERWLAACPDDRCAGSKIEQRLAKLNRK